MTNLTSLLPPPPPRMPIPWPPPPPPPAGVRRLPNPPHWGFTRSLNPVREDRWASKTALVRRHPMLPPLLASARRNSIIVAAMRSQQVPSLPPQVSTAALFSRAPCYSYRARGGAGVLWVAFGGSPGGHGGSRKPGWAAPTRFATLNFFTRI